MDENIAQRGIGKAAQEIKKKEGLGTELLVYADDVVICIIDEIAEIYSEFFRESAQEFELKVNLMKTKYLANKTKEELQELNICRVPKFRYFGTLLKIRGNLKLQIETTNGL